MVAFDGSMGLKGHWYPIAHAHLSPMRSMRVPARFAILVGLSLAVLSAFGVERIARRLRSTGTRAALAVLMTAAVLADVWPHLDLRPLWKTPPSIYASRSSRHSKRSRRSRQSSACRSMSGHHQYPASCRATAR